ncbi:O-succinylbenzoic acid--CoA ligase [Marivirga sericea]|uniref:O-succinylbenzoic acid--CoA ligase n=1 Tax=Marivirga sericea TaxID=1028 RepID=A0A1X7IE40_9BACT|nr:AMP-binding protein [Marivirga sericea]SMG12729.1 O-succinylbenzoic acid--CoA ligase [Marivirga sericea]
MPNKSFAENWIQFNSIKYSIADFINTYKSSSDKPIHTILSFLKEWRSDSSYISQKTSGSTGRPKIIKISKSQIKASALSTLNTLDLTAGDHALLCINPEYIGGKMMIARAIIGKLNLSISPIVSNPLQGFATTEAVDFFSFVPYQLEKILDETPNKIEFLNNSTAIILGGAPVSEILANKIKSTIHDAKVYSTYGMTETVSHVALKHINSAKSEAFKALKNVTFSTDNRDCLRIHAPAISGQDQLLTNDVVKLLSPVEFDWLGRYDYVINSGGIKIHPELLEKEIAEVFEINKIFNRFFIFGLPDEKLGQSMNLLLEGNMEEPNLYNLLKEHLPAFHAPKNIFSVSAFSETESGKINRLETIKIINKR